MLMFSSLSNEKLHRKIKKHTLGIFILCLICPSAFADDPTKLPKVSIDHVKSAYLGSFKIDYVTPGDFELSTWWANGRMAYNSKKNSVFVDSHAYKDSVAEFSIPANLSRSADASKLPQAALLQGFSTVFDKAVTGNTQTIDSIGAMAIINNQLFVQGYEYYDAPADNTHTTVVMRDINNIKASKVDGFFELEGGAKTVSYISEIPQNWQSLLGGTHLAGNGGGLAINTRLSMGPSLYTFNSNDFSSKDKGKVSSKRWMDYPLDNALSTTLFQHLDDYGIWDAFNQTGLSSGFAKSNNLWTEGSSAWFGFIPPGTRTYVVLGASSMHKTGGGYKAKQTDGYNCGGPCAFSPGDAYSYYWLYDLNDILNAKTTHEPIPYEYGEFENKFIKYKDGVLSGYPSGGAYDPATGKLFLLHHAATSGGGGGSPIISSYQFDMTGIPVNVQTTGVEAAAPPSVNTQTPPKAPMNINIKIIE